MRLLGDSLKEVYYGGNGMAGDGEEAEHLLRVMTDGHRKARRGRNLFCKQGVWREVIGLETYSSQ